MKQLFTFVLAAMAFVACTQNDVEELSANRADVPETLTVGFEGGDTRVELNEALKTVWTEGDEVSVYFYSDANQKWQYQGETGERLGTLRRVDASVATTQTDYVVVAYPYNTSYTLNRINANLIASLPAVQSYKEGSYGSEGNIMVAQSEFTQFSLKSVVGWLRVELTGEGQKVESITLRGNAGEQVAGLIYVDTATAEATLASEMGEASDEEQVGGVGGGLEFDDTVFTEVTLNCGEGVELGSEAKSFYIGLLPQTFGQGITIEVESIGYENMTMTTTEAITIKRNHIKPMQTQEYNGEVYQIYDLAYATNDSKAINPFTIEGFGAELDENIYDASTGKGILRFKGSITTIPAQAFGLCENLTWIDIPEGITTIGASAFTGCSALEEITIPASVTDVGNEAFKNCPCKAYINCLIPNGGYNTGFFQGAGFTEVIIGDNVTTIGNSAFQDCGSLTSVTIPDSVTTIGDEAFCYCGSLISVTIPDSVTTIGGHAFSWCSSLTSVTIPDSVTTIGGCAFACCDSLTSVYCKATTPPAGGGDMFNTSATIYIPEGSLRAYKMAEYWSEYADCFIECDFMNGGELEVVASDENVGYNDIDVKLSTAGHIYMYYKYIPSYEMSAYANDEAIMKMLLKEGDKRSTTEAVIARCSDVDEGDTITLVAAAVDTEGRIGKLFKKEYTTKVVEYNNLTVAAELSGSPSIKSAKFKVEAAGADHFIYIYAAAESGAWKSTYGGSVAKAGEYLVKNSTTSNVYNTSKSEYALKDGVIEITSSLESGKEHFFVVAAVDANGGVSRPKEVIFSPTMDLGDVVTRDEANWDFGYPKVEILDKSDHPQLGLSFTWTCDIQEGTTLYSAALFPSNFVGSFELSNGNTVERNIDTPEELIEYIISECDTLTMSEAGKSWVWSPDGKYYRAYKKEVFAEDGMHIIGYEIAYNEFSIPVMFYPYGSNGESFIYTFWIDKDGNFHEPFAVDPMTGKEVDIWTGAAL